MALRHIVILLSVMATVVLSKPASNEQLDNATVNDVSVNSVAAKKAEELGKNTSIEISGITAGGESIPQPDPTPFKPQRAGTMFARFIDDIFQIPITVLQSVAKLITNPFTTAKKTPEGAANHSSY